MDYQKENEAVMKSLGFPCMDFSPFDWTDRLKRDYLYAMTVISKAGFKPYKGTMNMFSLDFEGATIIISISRHGSTIEANALNFFAQATFLFGNVEELIPKFKRVIRAI